MSGGERKVTVTDSESLGGLCRLGRTGLLGPLLLSLFFSSFFLFFSNFLIFCIFCIKASNPVKPIAKSCKIQHYYLKQWRDIFHDETCIPQNFVNLAKILYCNNAKLG
jgi:hypothetical protein